LTIPSESEQLLEIVASIQERCKFYNYNIARSPLSALRDRTWRWRNLLGLKHLRNGIKAGALKVGEHYAEGVVLTICWGANPENDPMLEWVELLLESL